MDTNLAGKSVIVTGGNANAGRGITLAFAAAGCRVVVAARDSVAGRRVVETALSEGAQDAIWVQTDVLDTAQVEALLTTTLEHFGGIDVLVNNVGGGGVVDDKPFWETTPEEWAVDIDLTLMSVLNCTRAALPHMIEGGGGRIINIGSTSAISGDPTMAVYSAAKGAVHSFTTILAREVAPHKISVNTIAPWAILPEDPAQDTSSGSRLNPERGKFALLGRLAPERADYLKSRTLLGEPLDHPAVKPSEIGAAAVYLASEQASFVTGQTLVIDGGMLLKR